MPRNESVRETATRVVRKLERRGFLNMPTSQHADAILPEAIRVVEAVLKGDKTGDG